MVLLNTRGELQNSLTWFLPIVVLYGAMLILLPLLTHWLSAARRGSGIAGTLSGG